MSRTEQQFARLRRGARLRTAIGTLVLIAVVAVLALRALRQLPAPAPGVVVAAGEAEQQPRGGEGTGPGQESRARELVAGDADPAAGSRASPCPTFAVMLEQLVARFQAARAALPQGKRRSRAEWEQDFGPDVRRILACHQDAGELALAAVSESVGTAMATREPMLQCAILVSSAALSVWHDLARPTGTATGGTAKGDRTRLDSLVHEHLTTMTLEEPLGRVIGLSVLDRAPFLGVAHEERVRGMMRPDAKAPWLPPIARALLLTLWRNLLAEGLITREDLDRRMLALADTADSATRLAALLRLIESAAAQHAPWILDLIEGSDDRELVAQVAMALAARLPGDQAVAALLRLQAARPYETMLGAWLTLGERHPELLTSAYRTRLADDVDVPARAALVSALGMCRQEQAVPGLREAFEHDPSLQVRGNALLALLASPVRQSGEAALRVALQDRQFGADGTGIAYLVLALESCCAGEPSPDLVAEVGQRILHLPALRPDQREKVEGLLRRFTPGR